MRSRSMKEIDKPLPPIQRVNTFNHQKHNSIRLSPISKQVPSTVAEQKNEQKPEGSNKKLQIQTSSQKKLASMYKTLPKKRLESGYTSLNSSGYLKSLSPMSMSQIPSQNALLGTPNKQKQSKFKEERDALSISKVYSQRTSPKTSSKETSIRFPTQGSQNANTKAKSNVQSPIHMRRGLQMNHLKPFSQKSPLFPLISPKKTVSTKFAPKKASNL